MHLDPKFSCRRFIDPGCSHRGVRDDWKSASDRFLCLFDGSVGDRQGVPVGEIRRRVDHPAENRERLRRIGGNELVPQLSLYDLKALLFDLHRAGRQKVDTCPLF